VLLEGHHTPGLPGFPEARAGIEHFAAYIGRTYTVAGQSTQYQCDPLPGEGPCKGPTYTGPSTQVPGDKLIVGAFEMIVVQETPSERTFRHALVPSVSVSAAVDPPVPFLDGRTFAPLDGKWGVVVTRQ
jgi:hypothetical protein